MAAYQQSLRYIWILWNLASDTTFFAGYKIPFYLKLFYKSNRLHVLMVYRRDIPRGMLGNNRKACKSLAFGSWFTSFSRVLPTSRVGCHAAKPIESVVYYHKVMRKQMTFFFFFTRWCVEKKLRGSNTCPFENASLIRAPVPVPICVVEIRKCNIHDGENKG